jgi:hypothetical protein
MRYSSDKSGSKLIFITIAILFVYLAFFQFDFAKAYAFTVQSCLDFFRLF